MITLCILDGFGINNNELGNAVAAAKTLSNYGISIKISNDGSMQGFKIDKNKLRARPIFVIG